MLGPERAQTIAGPVLGFSSADEKPDALPPLTVVKLKPKPEAAPPAPPARPTGTLNLRNASLVEVIDALCRQLRINYILDPRVEGTVILNTYGETREIDTRALLDIILRMNGAAMVQVGQIYRIVPLAEASRLPVKPQINATEIPEDDQLMLNLIFLKYVSVEELAKLLEPFVGEGAQTWAYPPANLLLILDSRRNMRRAMELVSLFDSDALAAQRIRLFEVQHTRPSDMVKELETVLKSMSLTEKSLPVRFLPIDRINTIVAVAPNPGAFERVEEWIKKLDQPVKVTAGTIDNFVYRVQYARAEGLAMAIMQLYGGGFFGYGYGYGGFGGPMGLFSGAAAGFDNPYVSPYRGYQQPYGGYGGGLGGYGAYPGYGYGGYGGYGGAPFFPQPTAAPPAGGTAGAQAAAAPPADQTGAYLGYGAMGMQGMPRVVPNPLDNSLLIQATPQQYEQIRKLLRELDVPPRQVLIDAKIYEVSLTGAFAAGVSAYLQKLGQGSVSVPTRKLLGSSTTEGLSLSIGTLVGKSRELLSFLEAQETTTRAKVLSSPSLIATDSIPASINVGTEVPTLTAQAVTPIQAGGSSLFTNTIQNRNSGVTLNVLARVNESGAVTLIINQEVSTPIPPAPGEIQSPSFSKRTVQTQVTVQDGDTIAIGGIISETDSSSSGGVPGLHRIPILGLAFGGKSRSTERTELVVFMTPHVIYDTNQIIDATEELKSRFRKLSRLLRQNE